MTTNLVFSLCVCECDDEEEGMMLVTHFSVEASSFVGSYNDDTHDCITKKYTFD